MQDRFELWEKALTDLIDAYRDVERRALALPAIVLGQTPRRRWLRRSRGTKTGSSVYLFAPRVLIDYFLEEHFAARLHLARRSVLVDMSLTGEEQDRLTQRIDRALQIWPRQPAIDLLIRYVLPFGGILAGIVALGQAMLAALFRAPRGAPPNWPAIAIGYVLLFCLFPAVAWFAKRELMLGGPGTLAESSPSFKGAGAYDVESRVFGPLAPLRRELPFDLVFTTVVLTLVIAWFFVVETTSLPMLAGPVIAFALVLEATLLVAMFGLFRRRRRLGRW